MTKLQLEFIQRRTVGGLAWLFLLITVGIGMRQMQVWYAAKSELETVQAEVTQLQQASLEKQRRASTIVKEIDPAVLQKLKAKNTILAELNYSWNRVLTGIEYDVGNVAILSFSHEQASSTMQLSVEALDVAALISFVDKMNEDGSDRYWYLESYQIQNQSVPVTVKGLVGKVHFREIL